MTHPMTGRRGRRIRDFLSLLGLGCLAMATVFADARADSTAADDAATSYLIIRIHGLEAAPGQVLFGLYESEDSYRAERDLIGRTVACADGAIEIELDDLPPGQYAFKLFHDANGNGKLDTNIFGLPTEAYYFSNGASDLFSAPEWSEASFRLADGAFAYDVTLKG